MSQCPLFGKCSGITRELIAELSNKNLNVHYASERMKYEHVVCRGRGATTGQWFSCKKYEAERNLHASKQSR